MYPRFAPVSIPLNHSQQQAPSDCLAACASILLKYANLPFRYDRLLRLLRVQEQGAAFSNLRNLHELNVRFEIYHGDVRELYEQVNRRYPCIVAVQTGELPYWHDQTEHLNLSHAVVVSGFAGDQVEVYDPAFAHAPKQVSVGDFDLARIEQDEVYAIIE